MKNVFAAPPPAKIELKAVVFAKLCALQLRLDACAGDMALMIEDSSGTIQHINLADDDGDLIVACPANALTDNVNSLIAALRASDANLGGNTVVFACSGSDSAELLVTIVQGKKTIAKQRISPRQLPFVVSAPRGVEISLWCDPARVADAAVLADGQPLPILDVTDTAHGWTDICTRRWQIPAHLFDGKIHRLGVSINGVSDPVQTFAWQSAPAFAQEAIYDFISCGHLADSFPPHEVERVAAFLSAAEMPKADAPVTLRRSVPLSPEARQAPTTSLFVHHLTGVGAIASPTRMQVRDAIGSSCRTYALLPSVEAIEYATEVGRGDALLQMVTPMPLDRLRQHLASMPADERVVFLPGGTSLTAHGLDLLRQVDGRTHIAAPARTFRQSTWQVDVQPLATSLELFDACAILSAGAAAQAIEFGESKHDYATTLTCRINGVSNAPIARQIVRQTPGKPRPKQFRFVVDAQEIDDFPSFEADLVAVLGLSPNFAVIGPRALLLRLKENPATAGINGIISLGQQVRMNDPAITAGLPPMPSIYIAAENLATTRSLPSVEFRNGLAFALEQTACVSECRAYLAKARGFWNGEIHADEPAFIFNCHA